MLPIVADSDQIIETFTKPTLAQAAKSGVKITDIGQFVFKNCTIVLAQGSESGRFLGRMPWIREMVDPQVGETWVGVGTNGADFSLLAQRSAAHTVASFDGDVPSDVNHTEFYNELKMFEGATSVHFAIEDEDTGRTFPVVVELPASWTKSWIKQLSACKALQWLIAQDQSVISKPRGTKEDAFNFFAEFERCFGPAGDHALAE